MAAIDIKKMEKALIHLYIKPEDEKIRRKALRFAASIEGVEAVGLTGGDRNEVFVVGSNDHNWGELALKMKKKIGVETRLLWIEDIDWAGLIVSPRQIGSSYGGTGDGCTIL